MDYTGIFMKIKDKYLPIVTPPDFPAFHKLTIQGNFILILLTMLAINSCQKEDNDKEPELQYLVESELIAGYNRADILTTLENTEELPEGISFLVNYDISVYKIVYTTTDTRNTPVLASGALLVPETSQPLPLLSFQHGTLSSDEEAPSRFSEENYFASVLYASTGYIMALPDYLGYGISNHIDHPYEHGRSLATASRDMLRAVRELGATEELFSASNNLFLTGYSEGGYATMALLKLLEEEHSDEFSITAATAGAGAYNKSEFARQILLSDSNLYHLNAFLWVLDTYNNVYDLDRPYSFYFNEPHATLIETEGIFANTELNPQDLFTPDFREGILAGTDTEFIEVLADNDNYDWRPSSPLRLYHGTDDDYVFYLNSATAFEAMKNRGATDVELITVEGGDHATSIFDYLTGTFLFFAQLRN